MLLVYLLTLIAPYRCRRTQPVGQDEALSSREVIKYVEIVCYQCTYVSVTGADVLNQLAKMKQQLKNESKRVEADLRNEQEEPEVYDPRLQRRAEP